jgi:hypothetical protein
MLIQVNATHPLPITLCQPLPAASAIFHVANATGRTTMSRTNRLSFKSMTIAGLAASSLLGFALVTVSPAPAEAVVYCQYVDYPPSCVARAGVVLRPRPVARAAVRAGTVSRGNLNGGVDRVGVRR